MVVCDGIVIWLVSWVVRPNKSTSKQERDWIQTENLENIA